MVFLSFFKSHHDRGKASLVFEMDPENIKDWEQQRKVDIHLKNEPVHFYEKGFGKRKSREGETKRVA